jgi:hypothetical protein
MKLITVFAVVLLALAIYDEVANHGYYRSAYGQVVSRIAHSFGLR